MSESKHIRNVRKRVEDLLDKLRSRSAESEKKVENGFDRRDFIRMGAAAGAAASIGTLAAGSEALARSRGAAKPVPDAPSEIEEATIIDLQASMASGRLTSQEIVKIYQRRIAALDQSGPTVNAILELNPDALDIARSLDQERANHHVRGPLHGIPVLLKANIDTADKMQTTAGSMALIGTPPPQDSTVAARLRAAGAVILGKTNLSEWANFRSFFSSSGWSGIGGQCNNPYAIDRNPSGSSSGSAASVSANFTSVSLGTETDGSIISPANNNGVVGIKPTVGLTSRAGVVPISHNQDTVGPHARTVGDAAAVLGALVGVDPRDPATAASAGKFHSDYTQFLDVNGLKGARIGVARNGLSFPKAEVDSIFEDAIAAIKAAGAIVIDPADIPSIDQINSASGEFTVLLFDFKVDLAAYLSARTGVPIKTLADAIAFNSAHASTELKFFGQEIFEAAEPTDGFSDPAYIAALALDLQLGRSQGIDAVLQQFNLDAIIAPSGGPGWTTDLLNGDHFVFGSTTPCAIAGYPIINVPMGNYFGMPVGISFMGTAFSEPKLIKVASGFEAATKARIVPQFLPKLSFDSGGSQFAHGRAPKLDGRNLQKLM